MTKKTFNSFSSLVFSTNPEAMKEEPEESVAIIANDQQRLRVHIEKKHRGGKTVTLITGFEGSENSLNELAKKLKTKCGTGGTAKDGEILIQGEYKEKIVIWLKEWGYTQTK